MTNPTLNRGQVAQALGMHPRTLDKLRRTDPVFPRPFRPGGPRAFPRWRGDDIESYLEHRREPSQGEDER